MRLANAEASVAVMSGHFLQRGEPALVDKWVRAEMALSAGVDLVLELPFPFACSSAPHFARGAVQTLNALGIVDALCFGSEAGGLEPLQDIAALLVNHAEVVEAETRELLRSGVSYPSARAEVICAMAPNVSSELVAEPNNILGIEYLKALLTTSSRMQTLTIPRRGAGYHSLDVSTSIASATGIRKLIGEGGEVGALIPKAGLDILKEALEQGRSLDHVRLFTALQALLLQERETLYGICQVEDGLAQRLAEAAMTATTYAGLADAVKSRHWTLTRIQRILSYVLLQLSAEDMGQFLDCGPLYLRVLGATAKGEQVLAQARKKRSLPMISDPSRAHALFGRFYAGRKDLYRIAERMLACDLRATRIYGLLLKSQQQGHRNQDFFRDCLRRG